MDAWSTFEMALDARHSRKIELLMAAEEAVLDDNSVSPCDRDILLCCIAAVRVAERRGSVEEVADLSLAVSSRCGSSWPLYHLAESANAVGAHKQVLSAVSNIDAGFFESQDLMWRSARCAELRAVAMIKLMYSPRELAPVVSAIAAWYAANGECHDFAPPSDLVAALIEAGVPFQPSLEMLHHSLDLEMWLGPKVAESVRRALRGGATSDG